MELKNAQKELARNAQTIRIAVRSLLARTAWNWKFMEKALREENLSNPIITGLD